MTLEDIVRRLRAAAGRLNRRPSTSVLLLRVDADGELQCSVYLGGLCKTCDSLLSDLSDYAARRFEALHKRPPERR